MRRLFVLLAASFLGCSPKGEINWNRGSFEHILVTAYEQNKPILVNFYSPTCGACNRLDQAVYQNRQAARFINQTFVPFKVVKDVGEFVRLRDFFKMQGFPTIVVLAPDGVERDRMVGFDGDAQKFLATLQDWAMDEYTILSYLRRWAEDTTEVEWIYRIAQRYIDRNQPEQAQKFFKRILRLDPDDLNGYHAEAEFRMALYELRTTDDPATMTAVLAEETDRQRLNIGYSVLASFYERQGDHERTLAWYRDALQKLPDAANLLNAVAWFVYEQKLADHYSWAISCAERAVQIEPNDDGIWDTLAWLYHANENYAEAVAALEKAQRINPKAEYYQEMLVKMRADLRRQQGS